MNMEYRLDFLVELLSAAAMLATKILTVKFLFDSFHSMRGWNSYEVFFIFGFAQIPLALFSAFAMNFYQFSDKYLVQGELDRLLMRPLSALFQVIMEGIAFDFIAELGMGIAIVAFCWAHVGPAPTVDVIARFVLAIFGAWMLLTGVFLALISLSFWSQDRLSILPPVYNLMNFAQFPITIYNWFVRTLLTWVVPFAFASFYPAAGFLLKGADFKLFSLFSPLVGVLLLTFGILLWRRGMRQYSGAGS
jgi:ABC-2 type transport system permease protein